MRRRKDVGKGASRELRLSKLKRRLSGKEHDGWRKTKKLNKENDFLAMKKFKVQTRWV